jgi:hypothetical protein
MKPGNIIRSRFPKVSVLYGKYGVSFDVYATRRWKTFSIEDIGLVVSKMDHELGDTTKSAYTAYNTLALIGDELFWINPRDFNVISP